MWELGISFFSLHAMPTWDSGMRVNYIINITIQDKSQIPVGLIKDRAP